MAFQRNFPKEHVFERKTPQEIRELIIQKEDEGFEIVRQARPIEKKSFHGNEGQTKWIVVMRYQGRENG